MNRKMIRTYIMMMAVVMLFSLSCSRAASAFSVQETLASVLGKDKMVSNDDIRGVLKNSEAEKRASLLKDEEVFKTFIEQEAGRKSILRAAQGKGSGFDKNEAVALGIRRQLEDILIKFYIQQGINAGLDPAFPSEEEINQYYQKNKSAFLVEERIHLYQIFFPIPPGTDEKEIKKVEKTAKDLIKKIKDGKIDFAQAAQQYSGHQPSSLTGGYMGLLKVSTILPEVLEAAGKLKKDAISEPVKTQGGLHILKVGERVAAQQVPLDQARNSIKELLIKAWVQQKSQEIIDQARKEYPARPDDAEVKKMFEALKSEKF